MKKLFILSLCLLLFLPLAFASVNLTQDMVLYFALDSTSGTNAINSIAGKPNGTLSSGTGVWDAGIINNSMTPTSGKYVTVTQNSDINFIRSDSFSVAGWVYVQNNGNTRFIYGKRPQSAPFSGITIELRTDNRLRFYLGSNTGSIEVFSSALSENQWYHFVVTYDGSSSSGGVNIYINGASDINSASGSTTATLSTSIDLKIGANNDNGNPLTGKIDEFAIWKNRVLNSSTVSYLYTLQATNNSACAQYPTFDCSSPPTPTNLTFELDDIIEGTVNSFSVNLTLNGNSYLYSTTNGTITTNFTNQNYNVTGIAYVEFLAPLGFSRTYNYTNSSTTYIKGEVFTKTQFYEGTYGQYYFTNTSIPALSRLRIDNTNYINVNYSLLQPSSLPLGDSGFYTRNYLNVPLANILTNNFVLPRVYENFATTDQYTNAAINNVTFNTTTSDYLTYDGILYKNGYFTRTFTNITLPTLPTAKLIRNTFYNNTDTNVEIKDIFTNAVVTTANIYILSTDYVTINGNVTAPNYIPDTFTARSVAIALSFLIVPDNRININFLNEMTRQPVTNVDYQLVGLVHGFAYNSTSIVNITNIPPDNYEIRYSKDNYTSRSYFFTIPLVNFNQSNLNLYLLPTANSQNFVLTVTDTINQPISQAITASLLRRYVINNQTQYEVVEMMRPSFALGGSTPFTAVPNNVAYLFRIQLPDGTVIFQGSGLTTNNLETLYLIDEQIFIKVSLTESVFKRAENLRFIQSAITYNNISDTFFLSYSSSQPILQEMCLQVKTGNTVVGTQCSTSQQAVLSYAITPTNASVFTATAIAKVSDKDNVVNVMIKDFRPNDNIAKTLFRTMGIFFLVLTLVFVGVAYAAQPAFAIILAVVAIIGFSSSFLGLVAVPLLLQGTILIVAIILAFLTRKS